MQKCAHRMCNGCVRESKKGYNKTMKNLILGLVMLLSCGCETLEKGDK
jgi:hypothetical protein